MNFLDDFDDTENHLQDEIDHITLWERLSYFGNVQTHLLDKLLKQQPPLAMDFFSVNVWDVVWHQLIRTVPHIQLNVPNSQQFRTVMISNYRKERETQGAQSKQTGNHMLHFISKACDVQIQIISACPIFDDIYIQSPYGERRPSIILAHINRSFYASLVPVRTVHLPMVMLPNQVFDTFDNAWQHPNPSVNRPNINPREIINNLRQQFDGLAKLDNDLNRYKESEPRWRYDVRPPSELQNLIAANPDKYKECRLHLDDAHSGHAVPLDPSDHKLERINLFGRVSCGRAMEDDIVCVEITSGGHPPNGRVLGVISSDHKPVHQLYLCRMCSDQTSLMRPLERSFPKIHVNNQPAWDYYKAVEIPNLRQTFRNRGGLLTEREKDMLKPRHADHLYVSFYKALFDGYRVMFDPQRFTKVDRFGEHHRIFVVCYDKWDPCHLYPYGYVLGEVPAPTCLREAYPLLQMQYRVPLHISSTFRSNEQVRVCGNRKDFRNILTLAIDPAETKDIDDALSFRSGESNTGQRVYEVGIHIADVTHYVAMKTTVDEEARQRGRTFYPPKNLYDTERPVNMLPNNLAEDICSLRQGFDRYALSVTFLFSEDFSLKDHEPTIEESVICVDKNLDKAEVSRILRVVRTNDANEKALQYLFKIALQLRKSRKGEAAFSLEPKKKKFLGERNTLEASILVEEFMCLANCRVAEFLLERYPDFVLLRTQNSPDAGLASEWLERHSENVRLSGILTHLSRNCLDPNNATYKTKPAAEKVDALSLQVHYAIEENAREDKTREACQLICVEELYPMLTLAFHEWRSLMGRTDYVCSGDVESNEMGHFSLAVDAYVHFTSPIRRYPDIAIHRLLKTAIHGRAPPYNANAVARIAKSTRFIERTEQRFERSCKEVRIADMTAETPIRAHCVLAATTDNSLIFAHPFARNIGGDGVTRIRLSSLCLDDHKPLKSETLNQPLARLQWRHRIFVAPPSLTVHNHLRRNPTDDNKILSSTLLNYQVPRRVLDDVVSNFKSGGYLLESAVSESRRQMDHLVNTMQRAWQKPVLAPGEVADVISEIRPDALNEDEVHEYLTTFQMVVYPGTVFALQYTGGIQHQMPKCSVQLLEICPSFTLCIEHSDSPVESFEENVSKELRDTYDTLEEYKRALLPVLRMESVTSTIASGASFIIHDLAIMWFRRHHGTSSTLGVFFLKEDYCTKRRIHFSGVRLLSGTTDRMDDALYEGAICSTASDYVCVRCRLSTDGPVWVGHGGIVAIRRVSKQRPKTLGPNSKEGQKESEPKPDVTLQVVFKLGPHSKPLPKEALKAVCTVEVVSKPPGCRREESAVENIKKNGFAEKVVLGMNMHSREAINDVVHLMDSLDHAMMWHQLQLLNDFQREAVVEAVSEPFRLVFGPPGTGKTRTGCALAYAYFLRNHRQNLVDELPEEMGDGPDEKIQKRRQVLYCGPSNDSVNVVMGQMLEMFCKEPTSEKSRRPQVPRLIRVFGKALELRDCPIPGDELFELMDEGVQVPDWLRPHALHHVIRRRHDLALAPFATQILEFDELFRSHPFPRITEKNLLEYHSLIKKAKSHALVQYDMVLCTTIVSRTAAVQRVCHFDQVIIDEAGMCKESETLIPFGGKAAANCRHGVLIGDHKQLRPIIQCPDAARLGLEISLFERYSRINPRKVKRLKFQYRMHPSICEFPSKFFYDGHLCAKASPVWTGLTENDLQPNTVALWTGLNPQEVAQRGYQEKQRDRLVHLVPRRLWPGQRTLPFTCQALPDDPPVALPTRGVEERIVFIHVEGEEDSLSMSTREGGENSRANMEEVKEVVRVFKALVRRLPPGEEGYKHITVLSQYRLQVHKMTEALKAQDFPKPKVSSVIRSQGSEADYVIFSAVRTLKDPDIDSHPTPGWERKYLGFITDPNQVNVALTRARMGLVIIGNSKLLQVNHLWRSLITDLKSRGCFVDRAGLFLPNA